MAWIKTIHENDATGSLKNIYEDAGEKRGKLSNILRVHSLNPKALEDHLNLYMTLMFKKSGLRRFEKEMIAVLVSVSNQCEYCIEHHAVALNQYWKDSGKIEQFKQDYKSIVLEERQRFMLEYAKKLTTEPLATSEDDILAMRNAGFSDEDILEINMIVSYFNFVNRIALGLGVKSNHDEARGHNY